MVRLPEGNQPLSLQLASGAVTNGSSSGPNVDNLNDQSPAATPTFGNNRVSIGSSKSSGSSGIEKGSAADNSGMDSFLGKESSDHNLKVESQSGDVVMKDQSILQQ